MIKNIKHRGVHDIFGFIITLLSVKYEIFKKHSILVYVKKPEGFFFRRITTNGRDSPPLRKADDTPSLALARVCSRILRLHPWTPWTWGILSFRSIRI